ncbi:MAG TPA: LamG domain-containing protein [Gemmataceae bacterium]|nr:LamG domain-containing protein [Gemmataceae bacterium]
MKSASDRRRRAQSLIGLGAALLILAAVVCPAAAQPTEVLVYQFDPAVDNTTTIGGIIDHSGNGYNGTCSTILGYPGAMKIVGGHLATTFALATAGLDDFPTTVIWTGATTEQLGLTPTATSNGSFTIMAWVNRSNLRHEDQMVFGSTGSRDVGFAMHLGFRNYDTYFGLWGNDSSAQLQPTPLAGAWHHMAWRLDVSKGNEDIFIDGVLANSDPNHGPFNAADSVFLIGNTYYSDNGSFSGLIEYPRVFNVVLRDDQIKAAAQDKPLPP